MNQVISPPALTLKYFMCSQSGTIQDPDDYSGHSSSSIIGSIAEPDLSTKQDFTHHHSLGSDMGLRYMTIPAIDDVRFPDPDTSQSPVYSIEPTVQPSNSSSALSYSPYTNAYQPPLNSSFSSGVNPYYSPSPSVFSMPDIKPRLNSLNAIPGMSPISRTSTLPHPAITTRELYTSGTPHLRRSSDVFSKPLASATLRGMPISPSSSGFTSPTNMDNSQLPYHGSPPLDPTVVFYHLQTSDGQRITPEIFGKIDKGFFMADNDWTCYRRNYFSLSCSYTLKPSVPTGTLHILPAEDGRHSGGLSPRVHSLALSISAVVDDKDGKVIDLVQHTPKRDKGPTDQPKKIPLAPRPPNPSYGDSNVGSTSRNLYDQANYSQNSGQSSTEATFERIQFKCATANNGKRRAAQQYYHLVIDLFADVAQQHPDRWVKIASRTSAAMVVRGRSPGHYQGERRGSNASTGGSAGGASGSGTYASGNPRASDTSGSGSSSILHSNSHGNSYDGRSHYYRSNHPLQIPMEPIIPADDALKIDESNGYMYYPGTIWAGQETRHTLPSMSDIHSPKIKQEYSSAGYALPSLMSSHDGFARHCGRWEGQVDSKGYFPTALIQNELHMT